MKQSPAGITMQPKQKFLIAVLAGVFLLLQYALWLGDKNVFDWLRLKQSSEQTQQEITALQRENERLVVEVIDLKESGESVETIARSQYGLIKKDETFYQIIEE